MTKEAFIKLLVGRPGRLRLATWILANDEDFFYQFQAVTGTGDVISEVQICLGQLERLGLIEASPRSGREKYYRRLPSPTWDVFRSAIAAIASLDRESFFDEEHQGTKRGTVKPLPRRPPVRARDVARGSERKPRRSVSKRT
jgi:hypothetical protein